MKDTYQSTLDVERKGEDIHDLIEKSDYTRALEMLEEDDSVESITLKAEIHVKMKDYKKAVGLFDEALRIENNKETLKKKADALYRWAKIAYFPDNNLYRALDLIEEALEISPENEEYWFLKGEIHQSQENHIEARRCFLKAENRLEELQVLEDELHLFEVHKDDVLINITGVNFYRGIEVFEKGLILTLVRDEANEHDPDAIACYIDDDIVGYVANSQYTLINDVKGASDIKSSVGEKTEAEVLFIFQNEFVIARLKN